MSDFRDSCQQQAPEMLAWLDEVRAGFGPGVRLLHAKVGGEEWGRALPPLPPEPYSYGPPPKVVLPSYGYKKRATKRRGGDE